MSEENSRKDLIIKIRQIVRLLFCTTQFDFYHFADCKCNFNQGVHFEHWPCLIASGEEIFFRNNYMICSYITYSYFHFMFDPIHSVHKHVWFLLHTKYGEQEKKKQQLLQPRRYMEAQPHKLFMKTNWFSVVYRWFSLFSFVLICSHLVFLIQSVIKIDCLQFMNGANVYRLCLILYVQLVAMKRGKNKETFIARNFPMLKIYFLIVFAIHW